ncbi:RNA polymerase sigma-H factor [Sporomusa carbonis]
MDERIIEYVSKARAGDKEAFGQLVTAFQTRVFRVAYGIVGHKEDAEDIAQDTFVKAYRSISDLNADVTFYNWLMRIVANTSMNYKKSMHRQQFVPMDEVAEPVDQGETPEEAMERVEGNARVTALLAALPSEHRAVLALRELGGFSYDEISDILNIPLGTVKSRMNHGRDKLRGLVMKGGVKQ